MKYEELIVPLHNIEIDLKDLNIIHDLYYYQQMGARVVGENKELFKIQTGLNKGACFILIF